MDCSTLYETAFGDPSNPDICYHMPDKAQRTWEQTVTACSQLTAGGHAWSILEVRSFSELDFLQAKIRELTKYVIPYSHKYKLFFFFV